MPNSNDHIAQMIRLSRIESRLSLRELAAKTNLSHSYISKIERGSVHITPQTLTKLNEVLAIEVSFDKTCQAVFKPKFEKLLRKIIYSHFAEALPIADAIYLNRKRYQNCACHAEYYLIMTLYALHMARFSKFSPKFPDIIEPYMKKLKILSIGLTARNQDIYQIVKAMYLIHINKQAEALKGLERHVNKVEDANLKAMTYHLMAAIYVLDYEKQNLTLEVAKTAQDLFLSMNNFLRLMSLKLLIQSIHLITNRFDDFMRLYRELYGYSSIKGIVAIFISTRMNLVKYYTIREEYEEAYDVIQSLSIKHLPEYYCYKAYVLYQLSHFDEAQSTLELFNKSTLQKEAIMVAFSEAIEALITPTKDSLLMIKLKKFANQSHELKNVLLMRIAFKLYAHELVKKREYKEAFYYTDLMFSVLKQMT